MILHRTMKKERRRQSSCVRKKAIGFPVERQARKEQTAERFIRCKRFCSMWNCKTGTSATPRPEGFEFREGDYFGISDAYMGSMDYDPSLKYSPGDLFYWNDTLMIMGVKGMKEARNYRPDGEVETRPVHDDDLYVFDGQEWVLV